MTEIDDAVARIMQVSDGRAEYAEGAPNVPMYSMKEVLQVEANAYANAARLVADPAHNVRGLLPSWRWDEVAKTNYTRRDVVVEDCAVALETEADRIAQDWLDGGADTEELVKVNFLRHGAKLLRERG